MAQMKIDYKKLAVLLLPTFLRQPLLMSFARVLMTPSQRLHDEHHMARDERMYQLQHTSQICHIKDALNREFGAGNYAREPDYAAGFEIEDINAIGDWVMTYDEVPAFADVHTMVSDNDYLLVYDEAIITQATQSFIVYVPNDLDFNASLPKVRAIVDQYRLASRRALYMIKKS